ncbi:MAG: Gfo/Idh/MocA family protein [Verrucomicrobiales bacterium]
MSSDTHPLSPSRVHCLASDGPACQAAATSMKASTSACRRRPLVARRCFLRGAAAAVVAVPAVVRAQEPGLRAAVIGHTGRGDYGHGLEKIFEGRSGVELVALADPDATGRDKTAAAIGAPRRYADFREMLDKERPQLVSIAMRHADQHHEIGLACLRAGAHCYFEKPFTRSSAEADDLLAEASRRQLKIAVAHTMRVAPLLVRFRQAVRDGLLGDLKELRAYGKQDNRAGGEDMMVLGTHLFDLLRLFAGDPLWCSARVLSDGRDITRDDRRLVKDNVGFVAGDEVFAQFAFAGGVQASFTSSARLRETVGHWGIELLGSRGAARLNCDMSPNIFLRKTTGWDRAGRTDEFRPFEPELDKDPATHDLGPVGDWLEAIARDGEPECSGRNGAWAVEMVMAVYQSALRGAHMKFPLEDRAHPLAPTG